MSSSSSSSSSSNVGGKRPPPPPQQHPAVSKRRTTHPVGVGQHHDGNFAVYMQHKIQKLNQQHHPPNPTTTHDDDDNHTSSSSSSRLFVDCCFYVNAVTSIPVNDLKQHIVTHGGHFAGYLTSSVTHVICDHFTDAQLKRELAKQRRPSTVHYITSKWVIRSIEEKKKLSEHAFYPLELSALASTSSVGKKKEHSSAQSRVFLAPNKALSATTSLSNEEKEALIALINTFHLSAKSSQHLNFMLLQDLANQVLVTVLSKASDENSSNLTPVKLLHLYRHWLEQQELFEQVCPSFIIYDF